MWTLINQSHLLQFSNINKGDYMAENLDTKLAERIAKIETNLEHISQQMREQKEQIEMISNKLDIFNSHKLECDRTYVKHTDSSYFDKNIKRYENEKLQKTSTLVTIWNNSYKLILTVAGVIIIINNIINKG